MMYLFCNYLYFQIELPQFSEYYRMLLTFATIFLILMSLGVALTRLKVFSLNKAILLQLVELLWTNNWFHSHKIFLI